MNSTSYAGLVLAALLCLASAGIGEVYIQEFCADPLPVSGPGLDTNLDGVPASAGGQADDEFVEIVNLGPSIVDISNWTLSDSVTVRHTFTIGTFLPVGAAIVVFGGGDLTTFNGSGGSGVVASSGGLGLNNTGDTVLLSNASAAVVDTYAYGSGTPDDGDGESVTRTPENNTGTFTMHLLVNGVPHSAGFYNNGGSYFPAILPNPAYVGNGPDLDIDFDINGSDNDTGDDIHLVNGGDIVGIQVLSKNGTLNGSTFLLAASTFMTGSPPSPIAFSPSEAPSIHVSPFTLFFLVDGLLSPNLANPLPPVIAPGTGFLWAGQVPAALSGLGVSIMVQAVAIDPNIITNPLGLGACNAHEIRVN